MTVKAEEIDTRRAREVWAALSGLSDLERPSKSVQVIALALAVTRRTERDRCSAVAGLVKSGLTNGGARNACDDIRDKITR